MPKTLKNFEILNRITLTTESQRKAFIHPVRMKILGWLVKEAATITQIAEHLRVHPANITHHFKIMEKAGLISLIEERDVGRVIERYYRAKAMVFDILPADGEIPGANAKVLSFLRNDLGSAIARLKGDDSERVLGLIETARIDSSQYNEFCKELFRLIKSFEGTKSTEGNLYALNLSLYPHKADYGPLGKMEIRKKKSKLRLIKDSS